MYIIIICKHIKLIFYYREILQVSLLLVCFKKTEKSKQKINYITFNYVGHDTTAVSLSFAITQMGRNKEIQKKAREEVLSILGDKPEDVLPTKEDLKEMKYLDAVIREVYICIQIK